MKKRLILKDLPLDGLFIVYGGGARLFHGFQAEDVPEEYSAAEVVKLYADGRGAMIIEVK